jgi:hypothetical protein
MFNDIKLKNMAIKKETINGTKIICEVESSNINSAEFDTATSKLVIGFKNNAQYEYEDVPIQIFTRFRMSESQGSFFSKEISKKYKYKRL